jgi:site-specific DNA recombinase
MKAAYTRVSLDDQVQGYSLRNQLEECKQKAGTDKILEYSDPGWSGEVLERPGLNKMLDDIENGLIDEVYCYDPDRLARKLMNQLIIDERIRKHGVRLIFVNGEYAETPEGQLFFSLRGAISEFEKAKIKQRTVGGKVRKMKEGKILGAYGLYGYDYDKEKETYVINEKQAEIVRMMFDYFTDPSSPFRGINGIAKHLTELGIPTAKNKTVWHRQVVRQILLNESYTGRHPQRKYDSEGDYVRKQSGQKSQQKVRPKEEWLYTEIPRIISDEQYERAQELISTSRRRHAKESVNKYLLSGLVRCSDCGNTMTGRVARWWGKDRPEYTDIKNYSGAKFKGCGNNVERHILDELVWNHVLEILNEPEKALNRKKDNKSQYKQKELETVADQLEKIKKSRKRLISLAAMSDDTDLMEIKSQLSELKEKENSLQDKYNQLDEELKVNTVDRTEENLKAALNMYFVDKEKEVPFDVKQKIIRTLVKEIYVSKINDEVEIHI